MLYLPKVSLTGLTALLALLNHCQFYREMSVLLSTYYPQPTVQPTVVNDLIQLSASSSENTMSMLSKSCKLHVCVLTYEPRHEKT